MKQRDWKIETPEQAEKALEAARKTILMELKRKDPQPVELTAQPWEEPRSLEQNAYYWKMIVRPMANAFGLTEHEMNDELLMAYFGEKYIESPWGGRRVPVVRSSQLGKKRMHRFLDWAPTFAAEWGVPIE